MAALYHYLHPPQRSLWPLAVWQALERGCDVWPVVTITMPSGWHYRLAGGAVPISGKGHAYASVQPGGMGTVGAEINFENFRLCSQTTTVRIGDVGSDGGRIFSSLEARHRRALRGCAAEVRMHSSQWRDDEAPLVFVGILDAWPQVEPLVYELHLRTDDPWLELAKIPQPSITATDAPHADIDAIGEPYPLVYGRWDSAGISTRGLVPARRIDTEGFVYNISLGRLLSVDAVYEDDALTGRAYTITYERGGLSVTEIDFATDPGSATITVNCQGYEDIGDGTGTLITDPIRELWHALSQFAALNWQNGPWNPLDSRIDAPSWDYWARYFEGRGYLSSLYVGSRVTPSSLLTQMCSSLGLYPWWTPEGKIALALAEPLKARPYCSDLVLRTRDLYPGFSQPSVSAYATRRLNMTYLHDAAAGKLTQVLPLCDHTVVLRTSADRAVYHTEAKL